MIKLHASYGLKVPGAQEYSSESYHASAEIEVADTTLADGLEATLSSLWAKLRGAVEKEIEGAGRRPAGAATASVPGNGNGSARTNGGHHNGSNGNRSAHTSRVNGNGVHEVPATKKQLNYLLSCARRFKNLSADQTRQWLMADYKLSLDSLSKHDAMQVIDDLKRVSA